MNPAKFNSNVTIGELYEPAMRITTKEEASEYFEALVQRRMGRGYSRDAAEKLERDNLGYYSGYFNSETRRRVQELFSCEHPVFGKEPPQE